MIWNVVKNNAEQDNNLVIIEPVLLDPIFYRKDSFSTTQPTDEG